MTNKRMHIYVYINMINHMFVHVNWFVYPISIKYTSKQGYETHKLEFFKQINYHQLLEKDCTPVDSVLATVHRL